ncbi:hypothetical protein FRX31_004334 [Thalictrum thalictroides]|uniref:RNase H type-1 domain-containing protein n=1 Tax=Thalictrum thalictroides TaxID=46969 RepID=A0A7J6XAQ9_THATH|nr:hypothetical protein FRX31_004334 [Thalictrum thalictroides]
MPPNEDVVQISYDGSVEKDRAGFGGVMRDYLGGVKCLFSGGSSVRSVITQELLAIWHGIKGAKELGFEKIEVTSDSLRVVHLLQQKEAPPWYTKVERQVPIVLY